MARQNNAGYWAQRMKLMEDALKDRGYSYVENMERQFRIAQAEVERQISAWYGRAAANNEITLADAKRLLTAGELEEFRWTVGEYIAYGQQNALDGAWTKQLENASARVHISRLEALKLQIQQQAEVLYANQLDFVDAAAREAYLDSYYHTAFEVQRGLGVGWTIQAISEKTITKVLSRPWTTDGQTFRDKCWTNKQALVNSVNTQLTQMIIRGEAPDKAISAVAHQFKVSNGKAGRLIMTEAAAFSSAAQKDCYGELGVERFKVVATFDKDTCEICGALDGEVFKMADYQIGLTAPPFHPWCRCCTCPYFEDMAKLGERWTRNPDGSTSKVPADMTFDEWRQQFVQGPLPTGSIGGTISPAQQHFSGAVQGMNSMTQSYQDGLENRFATGTPAAQSAFSKYVTSSSVADGAYTGTSHFSPMTQKVNMNFAKDAVNPRGLGTTFFHEHGHYIDFLSCAGSGYTSTASAAFGAALRSDFDDYIKAAMKQHGVKKLDAYAIVSREIQGNMFNSISDLFGGMSRNRCLGNWYHKAPYWRDPGALEKEAFAHMFEAQFSADKYALMQKYFPTAFVEFEKLLNGVI
ncbi:MAG: minor capsid protein [Oscillospiraceae bacterium]|nr:minor capsid protein [Oscillospiraceae bacterium]